MDDNVINLRNGGVVGDGTALDPSQILKQPADRFEQVLVAGFTKDGEFVVQCSHGSLEALWIVERTRKFLIDLKG